MRFPSCLLLVVITACTARVQVPDECASAVDCLDGEGCVDGACVAMEEIILEAPATGGGCDGHADCATDQFCNASSKECAPLLDGWCRAVEHCGAERPLCAAPSSDALGKCVECATSADCDSGACAADGTCAPVVDEPAPVDDAEVDDAEVDDAEVDDGEPVDAGRVPDDAPVDAGAALDDDPPAADPAPPPPPPPPQQQQDVDCGPDAQFDGTYCVCDPGYEVNQTGDGCEDPCEVYGYYDDGICDDFCPYFDYDCF